jgi:hypothetical protein
MQLHRSGPPGKNSPIGPVPTGIANAGNSLEAEQHLRIAAWIEHAERFQVPRFGTFIPQLTAAFAGARYCWAAPCSGNRVWLTAGQRRAF